MNIGGVLNDLMFDCIRKVMSRISYYYVYIYGMECLLINLTKFIKLIYHVFYELWK